MGRGRHGAAASGQPVPGPGPLARPPGAAAWIRLKMPIGGEAPVDPTTALWECQWPADATSLTSSEREDWALSTTEKISVHADGNGTASPLPPGPRYVINRKEKDLFLKCNFDSIHLQADVLSIL